VADPPNRPSSANPRPVRIEWEDHACGLKIDGCPECQDRLKLLRDAWFDAIRAAFADIGEE
jgi:hypothetical protein